MGVGDGAALLLTAPPPQPAMSSTRENKLPAANIGRARPGEFLGNKTHPTTKPKERASHILDISGKGFLFPLIVEALAAAGSGGADEDALTPTVDAEINGLGKKAALCSCREPFATE